MHALVLHVMPQWIRISSPGSARRTYHRRAARSNSLGGEEDRRRLLGNSINIDGTTISNGSHGTGANQSNNGNLNRSWMTMKMPRAWSFGSGDNPSDGKATPSFSPRGQFGRDKHIRSPIAAKRSNDYYNVTRNGDGERSVRSITSPKDRLGYRSKEGSRIFQHSPQQRTYGAIKMSRGEGTWQGVHQLYH